MITVGDKVARGSIQTIIGLTTSNEGRDDDQIQPFEPGSGRRGHQGSPALTAFRDSLCSTKTSQKQRRSDGRAQVSHLSRDCSESN